MEVEVELELELELGVSRCPLSWLGCSWACARRAPHSPDYRLIFSHEDDNFSYRQVVFAPGPNPTSPPSRARLPCPTMERITSQACLQRSGQSSPHLRTRIACPFLGTSLTPAGAFLPAFLAASNSS